MRKFFFSAAVFFLVTSAYAEIPEKLVAALIEIESNGRDNLVGDKHLNDHAYGPLQIRRPCVEDVNRRGGTTYRAEDCLDNRALSIEICKKYLDQYATKKRLGHEPTLEDMARIWNGGPNGYRMKSTIPYWIKVQTVLKKSL